MIVQYDLPGGKAVHTAKTVSTGVGRVHRFERVNPKWGSTLTLVSKFRCAKCPFGSSPFPTSPHISPTNQMEDPDEPVVIASPSRCFLETLNDDTLLELSQHLLSETLTSLGTAYPRFHELIASAHVLLQRELRCFFLRTALNDSVLGIGIAFNPKSRVLSSDFDWLSLEAFKAYNVRKSIQKRAFQYFLPLAFSMSHFERVQEEVWTRLSILDRAVREAEIANSRRNRLISTRQTNPPQKRHQTVEVIYKMMNNIVVSLMNTCDISLDGESKNIMLPKGGLLYASEKAVISYCHLFHLVLCLTRSSPSILQDATYRLRQFIQIPATRVKAHVPDLGELIILITLVLACPSADGITIIWEVINGPFLEEAIIRNVRWILRDLPELEVMESGVSEYRLQRTFVQSKTSLRLIMFQIAFLDMFVKTYAVSGGLTRLDENYGFPDKEIPERMVEAIKEIYLVDSWPGFFKHVQYSRGMSFDEEKFSGMLRTAVRVSGQRGYHTPIDAQKLHILGEERDRMEKQWRAKRNNRKLHYDT